MVRTIHLIKKTQILPDYIQTRENIVVFPEVRETERHNIQVALLLKPELVPLSCRSCSAQLERRIVELYEGTRRPALRDNFHLMTPQPFTRCQALHYTIQLFSREEAKLNLVFFLSGTPTRLPCYRHLRPTA
eukprot:gb/GEZJ01004896.1/.p1 GENE.gb/GEZJ01004896.1/~~gb/GEZJ01004896.1/.p1  ORF type:complete len:132 (-),score=11.10 gb/GEZJ01004896.1/:1733-2128(-)